MINPISYTDKVVRDFLRYQLTAYPFTDPGLRSQMRRLLSIEHISRTPLMKGTFITLSKPFADGDTVASLCGPDAGQLHPHLTQLHPYESLYGHQARAIKHVLAGKSVLVSTGTGSGKTEAFLYPIISKGLRLRDQGAPAGISAVIIYPMNALAEDQLDRLRELLVGTGVSFGMYVGKTPETPERVTGKRLAANASKADYQAAIRQRDAEDEAYAIHPPEERPSRQEMRENPPRILLTNVKQLELLLTRQKDIELFSKATLDFLVVDEAHTFSGVPGAETAVLLRRLKSFCGKADAGVSCIATSATISDPERGAEAGREFVSRFFGVASDKVEVVTEEYRDDEWAPTRRVPAPPADPASNLHTVLELLEEEDPSSRIDLFFRTLTGERLDAARWKESLFERLSSNELVYQLAAMLRAPMPLESVLEELG
ncbi:MAG TPA: DEAD/DEAH box helicase, partial [Fimbriimonadaceae bacterium]|nr:DEAD/DEAH box helicase [Fimbriimonadaceae bacterium]